MNGHFATIDISSITPEIGELQALSIALDFISAKKYNWEDEGMEDFIKKITGNPDTTYFPKGEVVIVKDFLKGGKSWRLAWKFIVSALIPHSSQFVYVDAATGEVINIQSLILDTNVLGTADTRYSGSEDITADSFTGGFRLREIRNGVSLQTLNMQHGVNIANAVDFVDNDNDWTAAEYQNGNDDDAALDAHWASEAVLDYWRIVYNRNSIDNNGLAVRNYVHYGTNWNNARWDGVNHIMLYGDGVTNPLTSLDVCAHEFGHGVCQFLIPPTGLTYQGESGALNEGFSDIWGAAIEAWKAPDKEQWLLGEDLGLPIRSLSDPNLYGQPDTYGGDDWVDPSSSSDNGGVHTNSGVLNYWFFLLTEGGTGTNDNGDAYTVSGIGIDDASTIAYEAEQNLDASADFLSVRDVSIQAAADEFGPNSCEAVSVTNAWHAVGVGDAFDYNALYPLNGPYSFCATGTYSLTNVPVGATVSWSVMPAGIASLTQNGSSATLTKQQNGHVTLTAHIINGCASGDIIRADIQVGLNTPNYLMYAPNGYCIGDFYQCIAQSNNGPDVTYNWYINGSLYWYHGSKIQGTFQGSYNTIGLIVTQTGCGTSNEYSQYWDCNMAPSTIIPNPAQNIITISVSYKEPNMKLKDFSLATRKGITGIRLVQIFSASGALSMVKQFTGNLTQVQLDISNLSDGIYFVEISDGHYKETQKLIIRH